ncbi:MAG: hypothetical protein JWM06_947 [Actinomycetia bacterium]|nr:hypothetical protein [Actinomycetes bacterium]
MLVLMVGSAPASADVANPLTTTVLTVSPTSTVPGGSVTLTATVTGTGGNPPGSVRFDSVGGSNSGQIGSAVLAPVAGSSTTSQATLVTTAFAAGSYSIKATYSSTNFFSFFTSASALRPLTVAALAVVHNTTVTLTNSPTTVVTGQPETFTAVVARSDGTTPKPTGEVSFNDNGVLLDTAPVDANGTATLTVNGFTAGSHSVVALYSGDSVDHSSSSSNLTFQLAPVVTAVQTTTTVTASPNRIVAGQSVTVVAHVTQTGRTTTPPAGNRVLFYADGQLLGDAPLDASGNASKTVSGWLTKTYALTASYVGDVNNQPGSGSLQFQLSVMQDAAPLTVTASSATITYGDAVPAVSPTYAGFVNGDTAASLTAQATCTTTAAGGSPVGVYPVTCSGAAHPLYTVSYVAGKITILPATLTVTANNTAIVAGQAIPALTATITGFKNGQTLATSGVTGSPACTTTATTTSPVGTYPIVCTVGTLSATNYGFSFVAGTLTVAPVTPPVSCLDTSQSATSTAPAVGGLKCESLLAFPFSLGGSTSSGQTMAILYIDEGPIGSGALAPTALMGDGRSLPVTVTQVSGSSYGGSSSGYYALLTFTLPPNLAPGLYTVLLTAYDTDGDLDQFLWKVSISRPSTGGQTEQQWYQQTDFGQLPRGSLNGWGE